MQTDRNMQTDRKMKTDKNLETDKRSHKRVEGSGIVFYSDADPQKHHEKHEGQVVDICPDGICIRTRHEFELGSKMQIDIKEHYTGTLTGIVKRCVKNSDGKYHVGLEVPISDNSNTH